MGRRNESAVSRLVKRVTHDLHTTHQRKIDKANGVKPKDGHKRKRTKSRAADSGKERQGDFLAEAQRRVDAEEVKKERVKKAVKMMRTGGQSTSSSSKILEMIAKRRMRR